MSMEKVLLYEKAIGILNENYEQVKFFIVDGKNDVALYVYNSCNDYLHFMKRLGLIDYKEFCDLIDAHSDFFDKYFLS